MYALGRSWIIFHIYHRASIGLQLTSIQNKTFNTTCYKKQLSANLCSVSTKYGIITQNNLYHWQEHRRCRGTSTTLSYTRKIVPSLGIEPRFLACPALNSTLYTDWCVGVNVAFFFYVSVRYFLIHSDWIRRFWRGGEGEWGGGKDGIKRPDSILFKWLVDCRGRSQSYGTAQKKLV